MACTRISTRHQRDLVLKRQPVFQRVENLLHVHVEYLRRMVREGRIPAHRFPGGREIRFHRDELIAWVRAQPGEDRSPSAADKTQS